MDLLNATGEVIKQKFDGVEYVFPPNEVIRLSDEAGKHCLFKQSRKGLQDAPYGEDPKDIEFRSLEAIVTFHQDQIAEHKRLNEEQTEKKYPLLSKPDGVIQAEKALKVYLPIYNDRKVEAEEVEQEEFASDIASAMGKQPELAELEDETIEVLRSKAAGLDLSVKSNWNKKTLIAKIKRALAERESEDN